MQRIRAFIDIPIHPAADAWPLANEDEWSALTASIEAVGLKHPIVLCDGAILDGRNRYAACRAVGVKPTFVEFDGDDVAAFVWDENGPRRNVSQQVRYLVWRVLEKNSPELQQRIRALRAEGNQKRSESQKGVPKAEAKERRGTRCSATSGPHQERTVLASASHVDRGTVERMERLATKRPDLANQVRKQEMKPAEALRQLKKDEVAQKTVELPKGKFRVLYADPPWSYGDTRGGLDGYDQSAAAGQYPTMSKNDLCALDVGSLAADDSVLFCWATFPLLTDALDVVKAWGFKYKTAFVWSKLRPNLGHYHRADAELLLVATRGSATPDADKRECQVQAIERTGKHSSKPEEFRKMIDRMYATGPRIELFRRGDAPPGWEIWGNESN